MWLSTKLNVKEASKRKPGEKRAVIRVDIKGIVPVASANPNIVPPGCEHALHCKCSELSPTGRGANLSKILLGKLLASLKSHSTFKASDVFIHGHPVRRVNFTVLLLIKNE